MMEALGRWLLAVSAAALLVSVVQALIPEGGLRRTATFIGGLLLLAVLLRPAAELDLSGLSAGLSDWTEQGAQRQSELEAERTAAYISDKGAALGLAVTARVETENSPDGIPVPSAVELTGPRSAELSAYIAEELGIPPERQIWKEQDDET